MMNVIIYGVYGKMGRMLMQAADIHGMSIVAGIDAFKGEALAFPVFRSMKDCNVSADVLIDFSRPEAIREYLPCCCEKQLPVVIATTGIDANTQAYIAECAKSIPVFMSANMSLGVNLQAELAALAAKVFGGQCDIEIIEKHHRMKVDSPSGTALLLADHINEVFDSQKEYIYGRHSKQDKRASEIGIHAVRGGTVIGEHQILFIANDEVIEITHKAESRNVFANGAFKAAAFISDCPPGLYNMRDLIHATRN